MAAEHPSTPPPHAGGPRMSRRTLIKTVGLTAGAGAVGVSDLEPIGDAEALVTGHYLPGAASFITSAIDVLVGDSPPEGLTPDALKLMAYRMALTRESTNASTIVDNRNIINYLPEVAFSEAKKAALEAINDGKSQSEVEGAGKSAASSHYVTVEKNLLKSWNETINELQNTLATVDNHSNVTRADVLVQPTFLSGDSTIETINREFPTKTVTLRDGTTFDIQEINYYGTYSHPEYNSDYDWSATWSPVTTQSSVGDIQTLDQSKLDVSVNNPDGGQVNYLVDDKWTPIWSDIQSQFDQIDSNIVTWVDNTYGSVQQGEIDTADLITATDIANMSDVPRAVADLVAANIPVDLDNQLTIEMGAETMAGYLATTDQNALSEVAPDDTIDPNATDADGNDLYGDIYLAQDLAEWRYNWTAYDANKGVDGGVVWYTQDPAVIEEIKVDATLLHTIDTGAGERATVTPADFTETTDGSGNTVWEVDLSDKLETTITTIEDVTVALDVSSRYKTRILDEPFTVLSTESGDPVTMEQNRDPQNDQNYITQDEWDQLQQNQQDLIDEYEESQDSSLFGGLFDGGGLPTLPGLGVVESAVVVVLGILGLNAATS